LHPRLAIVLEKEALRSRLRFHLPIYIYISDPFNIDSAGYWTFDDGVGENTGRSKDITGDAIIGNDGGIISVPERSGKVVQCSGYQCFTFDVSETPCIQ